MNIIYIDDDATNRALLRDMLASRGLAMAEAADARSGLKMIDEGDFDIVFMDLRMPDMNGLTAIRHLRSVAKHGAKLRVVVVTADITDGARDLCLAAGADDFLDKPVYLDKLFGIIGAKPK